MKGRFLLLARQVKNRDNLSRVEFLFVQLEEVFRVK
jgi:hypothetical protein